MRSINHQIATCFVNLRDTCFVSARAFATDTPRQQLGARSLAAERLAYLEFNRITRCLFDKRNDVFFCRRRARACQPHTHKHATKQARRRIHEHQTTTKHKNTRRVHFLHIVDRKITTLPGRSTVTTSDRTRKHTRRTRIRRMSIQTMHRVWLGNTRQESEDGIHCWIASLLCY